MKNYKEISPIKNIISVIFDMNYMNMALLYGVLNLL